MFKTGIIDRFLPAFLGAKPRAGIQLKTPAEIEKMRAAGRIVHRVLHTCGAAVRPGITTNELEDIAIEIISANGGASPFVGYAPGDHPPYPAWTCISVNDEIVHGIPSRRALREGDIVTVDCGVELNGYLADSAWTFPVGKVSPQVEKLLRVTREALYKGIEQARSGRRTGDIGYAVQRYAEANGFSVVRELNGHGVGTSLHEDPQVPNHGRRGDGVRLQPGMTFAIEPMLNAGRKDIRSQDDGWTIVTADGSMSAHFEHTIAVTTGEPLILTNGD